MSEISEREKYLIEMIQWFKTKMDELLKLTQQVREQRDESMRLSAQWQELTEQFQRDLSIQRRPIPKDMVI